MPAITWDSRLASVAGKQADRIEKAFGYRTVGDLLRHYPRRYVPKGSLSDLGTLTVDEHVTVIARVLRVDLRTYSDRRTGRPAYRLEVLPSSVRARVSVEAAVPMGWREFVGDAGRIVGLDHYGASAAYTVLYEEFGLTAEAVVAAAHDSLAAASTAPVAPSGPDSSGVLHSPTGDR